MDKTLIIVGAGMSKSLGLPTTPEIHEILSILLDEQCCKSKSPSSIRQRLDHINSKMPLDEPARKDFEMTLSLLLDGDGARTEQAAEECRQRSLNEYCLLYDKYFLDGKVGSFRHYLNRVYQKYLLIDLKAIMCSLKESSPDGKIDLVKILTTINNAIESNIAIPTKEIFPDETKETLQLYYCERADLDGALNIYRLLVYKLFKHLLRTMNTSLLSRYEDFFYRLAKDFSELQTLNDVGKSFLRDNYLSPFAYLTYNWDPVLPFLGMKMNQKLNRELLEKSHAGTCKKVYMDFGSPFAGIKLSGEHMESAVYSFSEDAAFLINAFTKDSYTEKYTDVKSKILIKIIKLFVPHGLCNIRICPRCQNGFFIFPENLGEMDFRYISRLFCSDPIPSEVDMSFIKGPGYEKVKPKYLKGLPDELDCPICKHPVYFSNSFMEIQSIIKPEKPSTVNKIHFDYGDFFSQAKHVVSLGYSFPKDDVMNSVYLQTMRIRQEESNIAEKAKVTAVLLSRNRDLLLKPWYSVKETMRILGDKDTTGTRETIDVLKTFFKVENIRLNFMGFPSILDNVELKDIMIYK
ncbi:MAG: hypothetical protein WA126_07860 [Thermodesulfovibrionales bacterium]